jgi:hypothetical protein
MGKQAKEKERLVGGFAQMYDELAEWREEHAEASFPEDYRFVTR